MLSKTCKISVSDIENHPKLPWDVCSASFWSLRLNISKDVLEEHGYLFNSKCIMLQNIYKCEYVKKYPLLPWNFEGLVKSAPINELRKLNHVKCLCGHECHVVEGRALTPPFVFVSASSYIIRIRCTECDFTAFVLPNLSWNQHLQKKDYQKIIHLQVSNPSLTLDIIHDNLKNLVKRTDMPLNVNIPLDYLLRHWSQFFEMNDGRFFHSLSFYRFKPHNLTLIHREIRRQDKYKPGGEKYKQQLMEFSLLMAYKY